MDWLWIIRDILIILVALLSLVAIGLVIYAVLQILALVRTLRDQVPPLFATVRQTASTVEGTLGFVSERAVTPVVRGASLTAAVTRFLQVLFRGTPRRRP